VFFGATVTFANASGDERTVTIVGTDELDAGDERVSWRSPLATALLKSRVGDVVTVRTPRGPERLDVVDIRYDSLA
jgi:transcription elongation factor GreB